MVVRSFWIGALLAIPLAVFIAWTCLYHISESILSTNEALFIDDETDRLFSTFDINLDGVLDKHEFQTAVEHLNRRKELEKEVCVCTISGLEPKTRTFRNSYFENLPI